MAAYVLLQITITDQDRFDEYRIKAAATVETFGGSYIIRGGPLESLEGECPHSRCVVIRFPSTAQAKAWHASAEYQELLAIRQSCSNGFAFIAQGIQTQ